MSNGSPTAFRGANYPPSGLSHEQSFNLPNSSPRMMHVPVPHNSMGAANRPSPPMESALSPGIMASADPPSPLAAANGGTSSSYLPSRSFDRQPNTVVSNQYYVPQGEEVRVVPLGAEPSLGMQATYRTDQVRTFEAKMFYDRDGVRERDRGHGHHQHHHHQPQRDTSVPGRHCSRCMHGYDDSQSTGAYTSASRSVSSASRSVERHRPRCKECRREQRREAHRDVSKHGHGRHSSGRSGGHRLSTRPSSGPDYSRDRHHQRTYRGPSSDGTSSGRRRSGRVPGGTRRRSRSSDSYTGSRGRSWSSNRDSLVVVVGRRITSTNLHELRDPLRRKVAAQLAHRSPPGHRSRHENPHRSSRRQPRHGVVSKPRGTHSKGGHRHGRDRSAPPSHGHKISRRARSVSSTSSSSSSDSSSYRSRKSSDSLCPYHAALRKKHMRKHSKKPKKSHHHKSSPQVVKQREAHSSVEDVGSSSDEDGAQYFEPQTTHHYFHHYPELPSHKPNPFPLNTGTPLKRQGEEQGPGVAAVHHYPMSEKNAAKLKSGFPANPDTAKAPYDRLKISTFEFEQPQDPEYPMKA